MRGPGVVFLCWYFVKRARPLLSGQHYDVSCCLFESIPLVPCCPSSLSPFHNSCPFTYVCTFFFCKHPSIYVHSLFFPAHILNYVRFFFSVSIFLFPSLVLESRSVSIFLSSVFFHLTFIRSLFIYLHFPPFCNPWLLMISHVSCAIAKAVFFYHQVSWVPSTVSFFTFR